MFERIFTSGPIKNEAGILSNQNELQIIALGNIESALYKNISVFERIECRKGGTLRLKYEIPTLADEVKVDVRLKIHKNSIPEDMDMLMSIESD